MTAIYFRLFFFITLGFLILSIAARALGSTQPPNPALRGFTEGCEHTSRPCWYGILLGTTKLSDALPTLNRYRTDWYADRVILEDDLNQLGCDIYIFFALDSNQSRNADSIINYMEFRDCISNRIGDVILAMRGVKGVLIGAGGGLFLLMENYASIQTGVFDPGWKTPHANFNMILMSAEIPNSLAYYKAWDGFIPQWRYCQLEQVPDNYCD